MFSKLKKLKNKVVPGSAPATSPSKQNLKPTLNPSKTSVATSTEAEKPIDVEPPSGDEEARERKVSVSESEQVPKEPGPQDLVLHDEKGGSTETSASSSEQDPEAGEKHTSGSKEKDLGILNEEQRKKLKKLTRWWRRFSGVLFSPIFVRHRNLFYVIVEVIVPAVVAFIIFAAFTSGISWKQNQFIRNQASQRNLNFPEESMDDAIKKFKQKFTDSSGRTLILFTPINDFTVSVMQHTLEQLGLRENNRLFKDQERTTASGIIGIQNEMELYEWALFHKSERISHGDPIGIVFRINDSDLNPLTKLPYNVTFLISLFDESIQETDDDYPFVEPAKDEKWKNPYISSGFIGLQYAIEHSFIRIILERQKEIEVEELQNQLMKQVVGSKGRILQEGEEEEYFDEDLFSFLVAEVNEDRQEQTEEYDEEKKIGAVGRSGAAEPVEKKPKNWSMRSRTIKTVNELPQRSMKMFSYNMFGREEYRRLVTNAMTFCLVFSCCFMSFFIVKQIAEENLSGIKDLLSMHGLPHHMHWIILLCHALVFRGITSGLMLIAMKIDFGTGSVLPLSRSDVIYLLLYVHELSLTAMNFFIAIYVTNVRMAGIMAVCSGLLSFYLPETFYEMNLVGIYTDFILTLVFPNWCLRHVLRCIVDHENDDKGITWNNIFELLNSKNRVSVGDGMFRLLAMAVIYFSIACYVDMTTASKMYPPSYKWYQFREKAKQKQMSKELHEKLVDDIEAGRGNDFEKTGVYEDPPPNTKCFVHVRKISKTFGKHKVALDSINMNILHGEITVILGHSGCGKSTLIATLAGLVQPSSGYVVVKGFDVQYNSTRAREYIGFCPQKIVTFNLLTVKEHANLCYRLKGYNSKEINRHVTALLNKLNLWHVRNFLPHHLRLDELRKLGMAMAIGGNPKVVMLDEPTCGMDMMGRHEVWNIIRQLKQHHTIIITTNLMDEAEYLADRLAVFAHGRLVSFGSLEFLRKQYDTGYYLRIEPLQPSIRMDSHAILNFIRKRLDEPDIDIKRTSRVKDVDSLVIELPQEKKDDFADLCDEMENQKKAFNIGKYSIRQVNMKDIFIKISHSVAAEGQAVDLYVRRDSAGDIKSVLTTELPAPPEESEKIISHKYHFQALLKKRVTVFKSGNYRILIHYLLPLIVVCVLVFQAKILVQSQHDHPEREMTTSRFNKDFQIFYRMGMDDTTVNYSRHLTTVLSPHGVALDKTERVFTKLYEVLKSPKDPSRTENGIGYIKDAHMIAFEFRKLGTRNFDTYDFVGYFASGSLHSPPVALNIMSNVYLSALSFSENQQNTQSRYSITVINDPMPHIADGKFEKGCGITCILLAMLMSYSVAFLSHSCLLLPMEERENGMRHIQRMCGVHPAIYWAANFTVDMVVMLVLTILIVIIFLADFFKTFHEVSVILTLWLVCILYLMWSGLMYSYFMSSIIPRYLNGFNFLAIVHLLIGILPMLWTAVQAPGEGAGDFWRNFFLFLIPPYTITYAFYNFFNNVAQRNICRSQNQYYQQICDVQNNPHDHIKHHGHYRTERDQLITLSTTDKKLSRCCPRICLVSSTCFERPGMFSLSNESWHRPGLISDVIALFFQGFLFWGLLIMAEKKVISLLIQRIVTNFLENKNKPGEEQNVTISKKMRDVRHEYLSVRADLAEPTFPEDVALICVELTKSAASKMIIKDFCLEAKTGSCIAILGRGGSGKSCIARMVVGELVPTSGNCYIGKSSLTTNTKDYLSRFGYCPQKNCLFPEFTGAQMVELMGQLRGIPQNLLSTHVDKWLFVMGLREIAHDVCKSYGDGMKHRLCVAMAFIGDPEIILLDEPTTGVDAMSRERLWAVIEHLNAVGRTIIFTTYDTNEAFSLAEKVAIIAEGRTQCIGTPQNLQTTYAKGHTITFKIKHEVLQTLEIMAVTEDRINEFKEHVVKTYKHIDLLDEHDEFILFFLRDARFTWAEVYRRASYLATVHSVIIDSFEVSEGEIDDIFIFLTNKQQELSKPRHKEPPEYFRLLKEEADKTEGGLKSHQPTI